MWTCVLTRQVQMCFALCNGILLFGCKKKNIHTVIPCNVIAKVRSIPKNINKPTVPYL